jgi:tetratricopeptide (TPR) repeat protein
MRGWLLPLMLAGFALLGVPVLAASPTKNTPEYRQTLVEQEKYPEALQAYKQALEKDPKNPELLYNTGLIAYLSGQPKEAVLHWSRLKEIDPTDWRLRTKLIQGYEAAVQPKQRDAERAELLALRKRSGDEELRKLKFYCRDQFVVGQGRMMVFEYFELVGDEPIRWSFNLFEPDGRTVNARYTLGTSRTETAFARERKLIKPGQRLFYLDGYLQGDAQALFAVFVGEPSYDEVKAAVLQILHGQRKPLGATIPAPGHPSR